MESPEMTPRPTGTPPPGTYATLYIKPVMPGYIVEIGQAAPFKGKVPGGGPGRTGLSSPGPESDCDNVSWRGSIPCMPRKLAIFLCICNLLVPGLGTFLSGWTTLCISRVRLPGGSRLVCVTINMWVSFLQLITTFIFLAGWFWSLYWAAIFVNLSDDWERYRDGSSVSGDGEIVSTTSSGNHSLRGASSKVTPEEEPGGEALHETTERRPSAVSEDIAKRELEAQLDALDNQAEIDLGAPAPNQTHRPALDVRMEHQPPPSLMAPALEGFDADGEPDIFNPYPGLNPNNRRHMQMIRRQGRLPPLVLTRERLEELVLNDGNRLMAREAARSGGIPPPPTRSQQRGRRSRQPD